MRQCALMASVLLLAAPAVALETPRACSAADPRVRCIAYDPAQVVQLFAATGARITANLAKLLSQHGGRGLISICTAGGMGVAAILETANAAEMHQAA